MVISWARQWESLLPPPALFQQHFGEGTLIYGCTIPLQSPPYNIIFDTIALIVFRRYPCIFLFLVLIIIIAIFLCISYALRFICLSLSLLVSLCFSCWSWSCVPLLALFTSQQMNQMQLLAYGLAEGIITITIKLAVCLPRPSCAIRIQPPFQNSNFHH